MGLDSVELILEAEEEFQIAISDEEAFQCETPDMLTSLIYSKLRKSAQEACPSMHGFYVARKSLMSFFSIPREKIRPEAMLEDLIARKNRRRLWPEFLKTLSSGKTMYAPMIRPKWLSMVPYVVSLIAFVFIYLVTEIPSLSLILSFLSGAVFYSATSFLSIEFPKEFKSVKDLTRIVSTLDVTVWNRNDVYLRVKKLVSEQLGIDENEIKPNSHFIRDLGMG